MKNITKHKNTTAMNHLATIYQTTGRAGAAPAAKHKAAHRIMALAALLALMLAIGNQALAQTYTQTFTANGTFTVPASATKVEVQAWGGGGGGGAAGNGLFGTGRGGGGAGGAFTRAYPSVTGIYTITVGAGGAGGTGSNNNATAGGESSFGTLVTAAGGAQGANGANGNGAGGGVTTGGTYNGGAGAAGSNSGSGGGGGGAGNGGDGGSASTTTGGTGGTGTIPGGDGANGRTSGNQNGLSATALAGGGGGALRSDWFGTQNGGAGFRGQVIVSWITAGITPGSQSITYGTTVNLNGNPAGGSGYTHAWTGTGATYLSATNTQTPTFGVAPVGSYTLTYTVTDSRGCEAVSTITITVTAPPVTITTGTIAGSPFCAGAAVSVPFTITGTFNAGNVFTAQLSNASGSFASPVSIGTLSGTSGGTILATIPAGTATGTGYRIRVVSSNPAFNGTDNGTNLTINALPAAPTSGGNQQVCANVSVPLTVSVAGGETADWYDAASGGTLLQASSTSYTPSSPGTYYAGARNTTTGCISASRTGVTLSHIPIPTATLSATPSTICQGDIMELEIDFTGTAPYNFTLNGGASPVNYTNITNDPYYIYLTPSASTTYYLSAFTDATGCTGTANSQAVTVEPAAVDGAVSGGNSPICLGNSTGTMLLSGNSGTVVKWQKRLDGGSWVDIANTGTTYQDTPSSSGTWDYRAVTNIGGTCYAISGYTTITVNARLMAFISGNNQICSGDQTDLTIYVTAHGAWTLTLNPGVGTITGTGNSTVTKTVSPAETTVYTIASLVTSDCSALPGDLTGSATVTIDPSCSAIIIHRPAQLTAVISGSQVLCPGTTSATITVTIAGGNKPWYVAWFDEWDYGVDNNINTSPHNIIVSPLEDYTYSAENFYITDINECQCNITGEAVITFAEIEFTVSSSEISCFGADDGSITITVEKGDGPFYYSIDNGITYSDEAHASPIIITGLGPGVYKVRVMDQNNCESPECE